MSIFRRMTLAAGLAAPLFALPALAQPQITIQHGLPPNSHTGLGATTFKENFERLERRFHAIARPGADPGALAGRLPQGDGCRDA